MAVNPGEKENLVIPARYLPWMVPVLLMLLGVGGGSMYTGYRVTADPQARADPWTRTDAMKQAAEERAEVSRQAEAQRAEFTAMLNAQATLHGKELGFMERKYDQLSQQLASLQTQQAGYYKQVLENMAKIQGQLASGR